MKYVAKIKKDSVLAMKAKEKETLSVLRLLIAELEKEKVFNKLIEVTDLSDEQTLKVIKRQLKKLNKELDTYKKVGRNTEKQEYEIEVLSHYLIEFK